MLSFHFNSGARFGLPCSSYWLWLPAAALVTKALNDGSETGCDLAFFIVPLVVFQYSRMFISTSSDSFPNITADHQLPQEAHEKTA